VNKLIKNATLMIMLLTVVGCSSTGNISSKSIGATDAIITSKSTPFLKKMFIPIGTHINVDIRKVDGKDLANKIGSVVLDYPQEIVVVSGYHVLELNCAGTIDRNIHFGNTVSLNVDLKGGHIYQLQPSLNSNNGCSVEIVDITYKNI